MWAFFCCFFCSLARMRIHTGAGARKNNVGKMREKYSKRLDEIREKWYDYTMANDIEINEKIAKNLIFYRKLAGMTQAELAEKISYSDKSVSKWESGNGVPDVYTLMQIAELFGVTLNDLVKSGEPVRPKSKEHGLHALILLLSSGILWLAATLFYVSMQLFGPVGDWWLAFLYAIPLNAILLLVFACIWRYRTLNFICVSVIIWTSLLCIYLTVKCVSIRLGNSYAGLWLMFLLGTPLQILDVLWVFFRSLFRKKKKRKAELEEFSKE